MLAKKIFKAMHKETYCKCVKKTEQEYIEHYILFERININRGRTHSDMDSGDEADTVTKLQNSDCSFRQTLCILSDILA